MTAAPGKLTNKQARFVAEYLVDLNATQAAIRAGYSAATAGKIGSENLSKPEVSAAITLAQLARSSRTEITADAVLQSLSRIAFGDLRKMFDPNGGLKPICELDDDTAGMLAGIEMDTSTESGRDGDPVVTTRTAKIRRADQLKALELLGKHLGMFAEKVEHTGSVKFVIER